MVLHRLYNSKYDLYNEILDYLSELMSKLDKENYSILGLYSYYENHYNIVNNDDYVYSKLLNEDHLLRFDYKKKITIDKFTKFIDYNIAQGKYIEIKIIYNLRDVIKVLKMSFNFYYKSSQESKVYSLFKPNYIQERIYHSKKDILTWCDINGNQMIKEYLSRNIIGGNSKQEMISSIKKLHEEKEISIVDILS